MCEEGAHAVGFGAPFGEVVHDIAEVRASEQAIECVCFDRVDGRRLDREAFAINEYPFGVIREFHVDL